MKVIARKIKMISWTDEDGKIYPIRFKIEQQGGETHVYQVQKVSSTELEKFAGNKIYKFNCEIIVNEEVKICEIRYELDTCKWVLFKI